MKFLIKCEWVAGMELGTTNSPEGKFLRAFDPDHADGMGAASWTSDQSRAIRFPDAITALNEWKRPSTIRPLRADGQPNRPLTAYTVSLEPVEE